MTDAEAGKKAAAVRAAGYVEDGMTVGLGTGSTAKYLVLELGRRVAEGLSIRGVPTSVQTAQLAESVGIPLPNPAEVRGIDLTIDGADELDGALRLIKGGGGALLREKIVAANSDRMIVIADASKKVGTLGAFPLPVEVVRFSYEWTTAKIATLGAAPVLRLTDSGAPFRTDGGNFILDIPFGKIDDPEQVADALSKIPGVVEHGLFIGLATRAILGDGDSVEVIEKP